MFKPYVVEGQQLRLVLKGHNLIGHGSVFQGSSLIEFGEGTYCAGHCIIASNERVSIGKNVMIADMVSIRDTDHQVSQCDIPMVNQGIKTRPVIIEDDVWIAHGVIILKGVTVGTGSVLAAGSVVTRDVPPYAVVAGVPARVIRYRRGDAEQGHDG